MEDFDFSTNRQKDLIFRAKYIASEKNFMLFIKSFSHDSLKNLSIGNAETLNEKQAIGNYDSKHATIRLICFYNAPKPNNIAH